MSSDRIRLSVAAARRHSELALVGLGYEAEEAAIIADHAIVQAFGVLARSALDPEKDDGYLFVFFKPELLTDLDDFKRELSELVARVKATPRAQGVAEIRVPGERAFRSRERLRSEGIELDRQVYEALASFHPKRTRLTRPPSPHPEKARLRRLRLLTVAGLPSQARRSR
jgi:LDH2 family malate/lactate/ureidoglycolate dehydrogenase